jgi:hypothetical protein
MPLRAAAAKFTGADTERHPAMGALRSIAQWHTCC